MKLNNIKNLAYSGAFMLLGAMAISSCTEGNDWDVDSSSARLFAVNGEKISVEAADVTADVTFTSVPDAEYYIVEVSTDSLTDDIPLGGTEHSLVFGEDKSLTSSPITLTGLAGDTKYFLRMKSMSESVTESKWSYLRNNTISTKTFKTLAEQIFKDSEASDRKESSLHVAWDNTKAVTALTLKNGDGELLDSLLLDDATKAAGEYTFTGLTPSSTYIINIYNGTAKRGTLTLSTTAAMPEGDYKTELNAGITRITGALLTEIIEAAKAETGADNPSVTIGLQPDVTYTFASISDEDGSDTNVKLPEGASITFFGLAGGETPVLNCVKGLNIAGGHSYVRFENVNFVDAGCQYFINQSESATVDELSFKDCEFSNFERSLIRTQGSNAITINSIIVDNCVLTNMSTGDGYSVFHLDNSKQTIGGLTLTNSTFDTSKRSFIQNSKTAMANGIVISNCTFYNNVASGRYFADCNGMNTNITMTGVILGKSQTETSRGIRTAGVQTYTDCLRASDCIYSANDIKLLEASSYSSDDIFKDAANHDFTLKIGQKAGDPRWYPTE